MTSLTVDQMSAFQDEYYVLYKTETKTAEILDRIVYLEGIFENMDVAEL
mgnify:CR=1 FL=1